MAARKYSAHIDIEAPAPRVWEVMTDVVRWPEWTASVSEVQRLDDGDFAVGSRARIRQPRLRPAIWTVETIEPGAAFTWSTSTPGARIVGDHRIVEPDSASGGHARPAGCGAHRRQTGRWPGWPMCSTAGRRSATW
jgi:uncharacterized membrane protein